MLSRYNGLPVLFISSLDELLPERLYAALERIPPALPLADLRYLLPFWLRAVPAQLRHALAG
jgi:hypothetical protein